MKNNLAANVDSNISLYARYRGAIYSTYYVKKTFDANNLSVVAIDQGLGLKIFDADGKLHFDSTVKNHSDTGSFSCKS